jgi:hypothetical protein
MNALLDPPAIWDSEPGRGPALGTWPAAFDDPPVVERAWMALVGEMERPGRLDLQRALAFARARHGDQRRRGGDAPYWVHLIRVAMTLVRWGRAEPALLQAALLHDTVEDTETSVDEIAAGYGPEVAELVAWLTCPHSGVHHAAYYERLAEHGPEAARTLKVADRIDNLRSQEALLARTGARHAQWVHTYLERTDWQVLPLTRTSASPARAELVIAMADLSALVALSQESQAG